MSDFTLLIDKLDHITRQSLENAVALCLNWKHYNVELEHWLLSLIEQNNHHFIKALEKAQINIDKLTEDLTGALEQLKKGNEHSPALSDRILETINQAWLIGSLKADTTVINVALIACALREDHALKQITNGLSSELKKLDTLDLTQFALSYAQKEKQGDTPSSLASSKQSALQRFTLNLNEQAKQGKIDAVIGREEEVRQVIDILARRRQNNAILTGEPGVGKTAIVEGLALRIVQNDVPDTLKDVIIHSLDLGLLQAGAGVKGEFENRLKSLIHEIKSSTHPIILFIDEAHTLIGAGGQDGQNDAANLLKPALARGELRSIAATTWSEYKKYFEKDPALTRRFQNVKVNEPDTPKAIHMLRSMKAGLEKHHQVRILDEAICQAVLLSERYITGRQLPDKAISVLDTACARAKSKQTTLPAKIESLERQQTLLTQELNILEDESAQGISHSVKRLQEIKKQTQTIKETLYTLHSQWQKERECLAHIQTLTDQLKDQQSSKEKTVNSNELKKSLIKHQAKLKKIQKENPLLQVYVNQEIISEIIADWTGIPVGHMLENEAHRLLNLAKALQRHVIGQDHALETISATVQASRAKLTDPSKPMGIFLLAGPSGVGKTETALTLAESFYGSQSSMTTINMSEFKEPHKVSMLAGSPPGYIGYGEGGVLTEAVRRNPYSLLLLDEMEKAHPAIQDIFYQVFDKGTFKDGQGRDINFRNTVIMMTSNACDSLISKLYQANPNISLEALTHAIQPELLKTFKPAFLGRVKVIPYLPLQPKALQEITFLKLNKLAQRLINTYQIQVEYEATVIDHILNRCQNDLIGARQIDNIINTEILPEISQAFLHSVINKKLPKKLLVKIDDQGSWQFELNFSKRKAA